MRILNIVLILSAAAVVVSARRRYRIRYADEEDYEDQPIYVRRGRTRVFHDYGDMDTSSSRDGPVYVIQRGKASRGHSSPFRYRPKTIIYEEPYAEESAPPSRAPLPMLSGPNAFKPMVVVQGTYGIHPKSKSLVPYKGSHQPIPREVLEQI